MLPLLREQRAGAIINVSSVAAVCATPTVAYKASKAALNAYTQSLAIGNAKYGIRANAIMPGSDEHADGDRRDRRGDAASTRPS